jgi:hypothetical protein
MVTGKVYKFIYMKDLKEGVAWKYPELL